MNLRAYSSIHAIINCRCLLLLSCRGSYDLTGRVYASGSMGVPMALHVLSGDAGERVVYGDSKGAAVLLLCGSRELPARDLVSIDNHKVSTKGFNSPGLARELLCYCHVPVENCQREIWSAFKITR